MLPHNHSSFRMTSPTSHFLELPLEIRNCIYTYLFVDGDTICEERELRCDESDQICLSEIDDISREERLSSSEEGDFMSTASSAAATNDSIYPQLVHGAVIISELHPGRFKPGLRSTYWTVNWDQNKQIEQQTTYCIGSDIDLRLLRVCRQIYEEATYIFYTKNRFYVESIETLAPFLKDRSGRARALLKTLSIPIPCGTQRDEDGYRIRRYYSVNYSTFDAACRELSNHPELLANVKELDLRAWDFNTRYCVRANPALKTLKISTRRAKQLASIAEPGVMTLSFYDWQECGSCGPSSHSIFEPLPSSISRKIQRFREDFLWGTHSPKLDPIEGEEGDSESDENDDDDHYTSWTDILMGRRGTNAI